MAGRWWRGSETYFSAVESTLASSMASSSLALQMGRAEPLPLQACSPTRKSKLLTYQQRFLGQTTSPTVLADSLACRCLCG